MKIQLEQIDASDDRLCSELKAGEVVTHDVVISMDDRVRTFTVYLKANVLPGFDASLVYGDDRLEELLRFTPAALNTVYDAVGKHRRGTPLSLPIVLIDATREQESVRGRLEAQ